MEVVMEWSYDLGDEVEDIITGYKGIIRARSRCLSQTADAYGVQNPNLDEKGDTRSWKWLDGSHLKLVAKKKIAIEGASPPDFIVDIGDKVKDKITRKSGIVSELTQYLTGCNRYGIIHGKNLNEEIVHLEEGRVELVKKRAIDITTLLKKKDEGGPHSADEFPNTNRNSRDL
jgi:hypothetical protein